MGNPPDVARLPRMGGWRRPEDPAQRKESAMPRYIVERTFPDGLRIPMTGEGAVACLGVVGRNSDLGVTWIHSYVSDDKKKTYCVYDGPDPEAIRKAAQRNGLPVDSINKVSVLDPYFYV